MSKTFHSFRIIIYLLLLSQIAQAQKINLAELHSMSANKNWETSNKFLLSKGWEYYDSSVGDDEHYNKITWSFEKSYSNDKRANGWIYIYSYDGLPNKVMYRFRKKEYYTSIKNSLTVNGYKLDDEEILDQRVIAKYSNANYILELTYSREEDDDDYNGTGSFTAYEITVYKKGGVYDPNNGKKQEYDENGNLSVEYFLKNGKAEGIIKYYNSNGTLYRTSFMKNGVENGTSTQYLYKINESDTTDIVIGKYKGEIVNGNKNGKWLLNIIKDDVESTLSYENYTNGVKNGPYTEVKNDSLEVGNYKNDQLDGPHTLYRDLKKMFTGGLINTDTLKLKKITTGFYKENKKTGLWKTFGLSGLLLEEGHYVDSLQTGKWKYYYDKYVDQNDKEEAYSGKLYLEVNYKDGKKNGIATQYSFFDEIEEPCADDSTKTCTKKVFKKIKETSTYKDDVLDGPYELVDDNNQMLFKGNYSQGKENGIWTNSTVSLVDFWRGVTTETGIYVDGLRQQKWDRFDTKGELVESCTYKDDQLNGEQITYLDGKPRIKRMFNAGDFTEMTLIDSLGTTFLQYKLFEKNSTNYKCITKRFKSGKTITNTYKIKLFSGEKIIPAFFNNYFKEMPDEKKILEGYHEILDNQELVEKGTYANNEKSGIWTYIFYDQKIKVTIEYNSFGIPVIENYYDMNKLEPFSGEFIYKDEISGSIEERKIKDGLRNGTTRYKDANDKTIKKESYKDGVLKE